MGPAEAIDYIDTFVDNGQSQNINASDTATSTTVNFGGIQNINSDGSATSTTVNLGGNQFINSGGSASDTTLNGGGQHINSGGLATSTTVNSGSHQRIYSGGSAISTTVNSDSYQDINSGGSAISTTVNLGGNQFINSGGSASDTTLNGGGQHINSGGLATSTTVNSGSHQRIDSGGSAISTTVNSDSYQDINSGGSATSTTVNLGGNQFINSGGSASDTTLNGGGQHINSGGLATSTTVNSGSHQRIDSGGSAISTTVNSDSYQDINSGGSATSTTVNLGGSIILSGGGSATSTTVNSGGSFILSGGGVIDGTTTLMDGALLTGSSIINNGNLIYTLQGPNNYIGNLTGSGQLTKNGTGLLTLGGTLSQSQVNLNAGSLLMDGLQAFTNIIAQVGTTLSLINSATLTGIIDPTDLNIDSSSTWNITGDSLVDTLTNAGSIVFLPSQGAFTPQTLTATNLIGNGGTIALNTVAGDSNSPVDKVIIDGGRASGRTELRVLNRGGLGAQTTGNGIAVIQAVNGATTDLGAFSMTLPLSAGAYSYSLYRNADQSWYLTSQKTDSGNDGPVNYRDGMWSYAAMPSLSMDYDRLVAGTADTRFHYAPDSRIWGRVVAGQLRHPDSGSLTGGSVPKSSSAYSFFQLGGDLWQLEGANANWRAGIFGAIGLMRSDVWRDGGSADAGTDRDTVYTGGVYVSGRSHAGLHIDGLLQASRHNLKAASNDDTHLSTYGTGWLASAEVGQAFSVSPVLALEPQLQYTLQGLSLNDGQDEAASVSWSDSRRQSVRAGLKLGTPQDAKATLAWWVTPSVTQSYSGHSGFTASAPGLAGSEASFRSNISGTSVGLNGGVNARIRQNVTLGVQGGWSESLHGGEAGGYYGLINLGVSFR
ncbi:autotransporter domain-containing protein [Pantoea ananatis]|uniref:autotransporter domain-containing protein n=2 Tax=Pantoea ananas TaxID=553 RepID=UPI002B26BDED|nr:autotransporter domain-containing protein [Pantoea ananatis]